jgi:predicted ribosome quality control (RQC) complex YloA/Tae2 family protein
MTGERESADAELQQLRRKLVSKLDAAIRRRRGKLKKLSEALAECGNEEKYRRFGELLKANLSVLKRGQDRAKVADYYAENQPEIEIELVPEKTPLENMERYFKRARKLRRGRPRIEKEMEAARDEASRLDGLAVSVENAPDYEKLVEIAQKVEEALAPKRLKKPKGTPLAKLGPKRFVSSEGYEILVGRNQRQNDRLTLTIAHGSDLFMHAGGAPGSHVIIRAQGPRDFPRQTMLEAANLAAHYSKARNSRFVEVSWTHVKNVRKPRGAKPGLVYLSKHKILAIEPDEELVRILHTNAREL